MLVGCVQERRDPTKDRVSEREGRGGHHCKGTKPNPMETPPMSRPNAPWYRSAKDCWYVKVEGRTHSLKVKGRGNERAAWTAFNTLLDQLQTQPTDPAPTPLPVAGPLTVADPVTPIGTLTVAGLVERFLVDARTRLKPKTVTRYLDDTKTFLEQYGSLPLTSLTHNHIRTWLNGRKVGSTTKAIMLASVASALGWAVREELIEVNPARKVPRPKRRS